MTNVSSNRGNINIKGIILSLENNPNIMNYTLKGINEPIWPLIRYQLLSEIKSELSSTYGGGRLETTKLSRKITLEYIISSFKNGIKKHSGSYDILFFNSDVYNNVIKEGKYYNRLYDYYALNYSGNSLSIEASHNMTYHEPRYFESVKYLDDILLSAKIKSLLKRQPNKICSKEKGSLIRYFEMCLNEQLGEGNIKEYSVIIERIIDRIYNRESFINYFSDEIEQVLKRLEPKVVFVDDAHYGYLKAIIIKRCREKGIKTVELQHGNIGKEHIAYNINSKLISDGRYTNYLPDYLLTFGDYWGEQTNTSSQIITMGNPHLNHWQNKNVTQRKIDYIYDFLIISQWTITMELVQLAIDLKKQNSNYNICFRLHPGEKSKLSGFKEILEDNGITIDYEHNLYDLILESCNVVGCYSTVLWEALKFTKRIYIYNFDKSIESYTKDMIGITFTGAKELVSMTKGGIELDFDVNKIWDPNWEENCLNFVDKLTCKKGLGMK